MDTLTDRVFKGCTRPAMLWGVPLAPLLMVIGSMLIPAIWVLMASPPLGVAIVSLTIPVFATMRMITRQDDQRLGQRMLRMKMRLRQRNRRFWGAHAYVPIRFQRRG
ncbi:MAG: VirB3 family type IV secretion system protein [Burkholderia sp.]|uniref:type IV secretion system protein VirB3 n=1 Tax=Burkholderia sp. TaxID=36773 RepID=UPI00258ED9D2|nr:VirB3 family type IV secretion system protein [Burkholderia sp.]MCA3779122.1 VirB3 family type IV secretion system protein [Burkholderia sp.]MCA3788709.1 VirB3 family type IV secretion system protein [Burkholderia sp.]MCA3797158.1 VirB3 family type IV secretion system protein [Burkholderia sp.]MCA3806257.1 VirB3 family type IV secretion system protein [Burkholderia sp.]MCA3812092.1 VirB3 family type IV secretion system protein [Burkholderia sp.]